MQEAAVGSRRLLMEERVLRMTAQSLARGSGGLRWFSERAIAAGAAAMKVD